MGDNRFRQWLRGVRGQRGLQPWQECNSSWSRCKRGLAMSAGKPLKMSEAARVR